MLLNLSRLAAHAGGKPPLAHPPPLLAAVSHSPPHRPSGCHLQYGSGGTQARLREVRELMSELPPRCRLVLAGDVNLREAEEAMGARSWMAAVCCDPLAPPALAAPSLLALPTRAALALPHAAKQWRRWAWRTLSTSWGPLIAPNAPGGWAGQQLAVAGI